MFNKIKYYSKKSLSNKLFISAIIVMTLSCLTNTFTSLFDGVAVSHLVGDFGTAARSLANPIDKLIIGFAQILGLGTQVVVTKYIAKGQKDKANKVFNTMFLLCFVFSASLMIIGVCIPKYLAIALSAGREVKPEVLNVTSDYLLGYMIGMPFMFINQLMSPLTYLDGNKRLTKISLTAAIIVNCTLTYVLGRFMDRKMLGVGLASAISAITCFIIFITHFFRKKSTIKFHYYKFDLKEFKDVVVNGSPMGLKYICITLKLHLFNIIILTVGNIYMPGAAEVILTARGAQETISGLFETSCGGILLTTIMMGTVFYNEENDFELKKFLTNVIKFTVCICYSIAIIYFFCARVIATAYLPKGSPSLDLCIFGMRCGAVTILFLPFNSLFLGLMQSTRRIKYAYIATCLQSFILPVGCMALFGFTMGAKGLFIGYMLSTMLYIPIHLLISIIVNKKFPRRFIEFFFLGKSFGFLDDKQINLNNPSSEVLKDYIKEFCESNNINKKKCDDVIKSSVSFINVIENKYYIDCAKKVNIDFRLTYKNKLLTILLRDNLNKIDIVKDKNQKIKSFIDSCKRNRISINYSYVLKTNTHKLIVN